MAKRFVRPKIEEVAAYCRDRGNNTDPEKFMDYYTANGFYVGKVPMKDWRAAVRLWERNDKSWGQEKAETPLEKLRRENAERKEASLFEGAN